MTDRAVRLRWPDDRSCRRGDGRRRDRKPAVPRPLHRGGGAAPAAGTGGARPAAAHPGPGGAAAAGRGGRVRVPAGRRRPGRPRRAPAHLGPLLPAGGRAQPESRSGAAAAGRSGLAAGPPAVPWHAGAGRRPARRRRRPLARVRPAAGARRRPGAGPLLQPRAAVRYSTVALRRGHRGRPGRARRGAPEPGGADDAPARRRPAAPGRGHLPARRPGGRPGRRRAPVPVRAAPR